MANERMTTGQSIGFNISWMARLLRTRFDARARSLGLTRAQWTMIATVRYAQGATQSDVAAQLYINTVTAGRILDRLEASGWVERRPDPEDRRANRIYLTAAATPMLDQLSALGAEETEIALRGFSETEQIEHNAFLERMIANMTATPVPCASGDEDDELANGSILANEV